MPLGLKNAPCTFQNLLREVLGNYWRKFAIGYLDDIIIYSNTEEEHLVQLGLVLDKLVFTALPATLRNFTSARRSWTI